MFCEDVEKRLELLDRGSVIISDRQMQLTEKEEQGAASLKLILQYPCILFCGLEKKKLQYFKNQKCSDYVLFEFAKDHWLLHIFELKRSVGVSEWERIKKQFLGALQNALALAGVLHIEMDLNDVYVYTVYRNDKINHMANTVKARLRMHEPNRFMQKETGGWNEKELAVDFLGRRSLVHQKIKLDIESGEGSFQLRFQQSKNASSSITPTVPSHINVSNKPQ